jgi:beta-glucosidase-like glycosyl hydrolase
MPKAPRALRRVVALATAACFCACASADAPVASGTPVQVWPCNASSPRQVWRLDAAPAPGQVRLGGAHGVPDSGLVLNVLGYSNATGGVLNAWVESNNGCQEYVWDTTTGRIRSPWNGLCAGSLNASGVLPAGTPVVQVPCADGAGAAIEWDYGADTGLFTWRRDATMCLDAGTAVSCADAVLAGLPFCNAALAATARAADLLARMQPVEKAAMLSTSNNGVPRLGVPALSFGEALHGVLVGCGAPYSDGDFTSTGCPTSFPTGLALGGTFNRTLWHAVGDAIGEEARALHNQGGASNMFFTPDVNCFRDARWGRGMEVAGEDPVLVAEFAAQYIYGFQGDTGGGAHSGGYVRSVSMAKHAIGYDQEGNGGVHDRTAFCANITPALLATYFAPPFKAALQRGKAGGVMCAASGFDSLPSCAHGDFNNGVMRASWGGDFAIVTDGNGIGYLYETYGSGAHALGCDNLAGAANATDAVRVGLRGGVDVELGGTLNANALAALAEGLITEADIDTALLRTLPMIFRLGLVDPPAMVPFSSLGPRDVDTPAHRQLALEAAQQAVILLRNNASNATGGAPLLPISLAALQAAGGALAVIGFSANDSSVQLANYHGPSPLADAHTPLLALQRAAAAAPGGPVAVRYAVGCVDGAPCEDSSGFLAAVTAAQGARVALVFCGLAPSNGGGAVPGKSEGEELDRVNITLPGLQEQLIAEIAATGTPIVLIVVRGGAIALSDELFADVARVPAIVHFPYGGELAGDALADVLLGAVSPSGRLATTQYGADIVDRSIIDYDLTSGDGLTHLYYRGTPQFAFGSGLSYTTFALSWAEGSSSTARVDAEDFVAGQQRGGGAAPSYQVNVTNVGAIVSDVSVLAFLDGPGTPGAPLQQLFDFGRISALLPGASATLTFSVPLDVAAEARADGSLALFPRGGAPRRVRIGLPGISMLEGALELCGGANAVEVAAPLLPPRRRQQ